MSTWFYTRDFNRMVKPDDVRDPTLSAIAVSTMKILQQGYYRDDEGSWIEIDDSLMKAYEGTVVITPDLTSPGLPMLTHESKNLTEFEITSETTLDAIERLSEEHLEDNIAALNFASAKRPGGGFLNGASTQEESLVRSSALYPCLSACYEDFYRENIKSKSATYSDDVIFSPDVPVIRNSDGDLLDLPYKVSFLTCAAVNKKFAKSMGTSMEDIGKCMSRRIQGILKVAEEKNCQVLVLGAFGCGVFGHEACAIAAMFKHHLQRRFKNCFKKVVFAVPGSGRTFKAFEKMVHQLQKE